MDLPSYDEARFHPAPRGGGVMITPPPPSYAVAGAATTPPPAYGDTVIVQPNQYPVLAPLSVPAGATSHHHNGVTVHPVTQVGVPRTAHSYPPHSYPPHSHPPHPAVVASQPTPVLVNPTNLRDAPALVRCPHCQHVVTTKVKYKPGDTAWCLCVLIACLGLICGFCLIPLLLRSMQDAHHSCPQCGKPVHVFKK